MKGVALFLTMALTCAFGLPATIYVPTDYSTIQEAIDAASLSDTLVVWRQSDGSDTQAFKSEYRSGNWSFPANLDDNFSPDGENIYDISAAMARHGEAIVVWRQSDGYNDQIFKSDYRNGQWNHPTGLSDNISPDGQDASDPCVAMSDGGDAVIVWSQSDGVDMQIFMSEYRGGVWTHPLDLLDNISPDGRNASDADLALNAAGDTLIAWSQSDGNDTQTFISEYWNGQWSHPAGLSDNISPDGTPTWPADVAIDDSGDAIIVWPQWNGPDYQIFMSERRGGVWTHPGLADGISPPGGDAWFPSVAMNSGGAALIAWPQYDGSVTSIFMSEYRGGYWHHPLDLWDTISPRGEYAYRPFAAMGTGGDAIIAWHQSDGNVSQIFKSECRRGQWVHPNDLSDNISPDNESSYEVTVAMRCHGDIIVWRQSDGSRYQVFKSEYSAGQWHHPNGLSDNISPDGQNTYEPMVVSGAQEADTIIVLPGVYVENIDFAGKPLTIQSAHGAELTIIDGRNPTDPDRGSVVAFRNGEGPDSALHGFSLINGTGTLDPLSSVRLGGAVYCSGSSPSITRNVIAHNSAESGGGVGCSRNSAPLLANNMIMQNHAHGADGGGLYFGRSAPVLTNNTIAANSAARTGGGIRAENDSALIVANTILWNNDAPTGPELSLGGAGQPSILTIDYSDVEGGQSAADVEAGSTLSWGAAMIESDPLFAAPLDNDFHLTIDSPCFNSGHNAAAGGDTDFEGDRRIALSTVDMGADEFYFHLYAVGHALPGGTVEVKIVGFPGTQSVQFAMGWGVNDPPVPTRHGDLWLTRPFVWVRNPGIVPSTGILTFSLVVPSSASQGDMFPYQALVGTWGYTHATLTNLMVLVVE